MGPLKSPLDPTPYPADPRSCPVAPGLSDGGYVYVRDTNGTVYVLPDGPHLHPKVLGNARLALYAGDMRWGGRVVDLTNLSGRFSSTTRKDWDVAAELRRRGLVVEPGRSASSADGAPVVLE